MSQIDMWWPVVVFGIVTFIVARVTFMMFPYSKITFWATRISFVILLLGLIELVLMWVCGLTINTRFSPFGALIAYTHLFVAPLVTIEIVSRIPRFGWRGSLTDWMLQEWREF
ncbi:hypothetical protein A3K24_02605 [candidate division Kazan bacterium RIFCSPHIGHO2_01_FULL_44_14]|uniref:Uncharacterized protein n=1 Tax=candidate division Kazan bacterium RIFCSPLOWO2_01_FULL_45_19 TaxID=1798538 RepID=A0A1F4NS27_UNCK3|nr:hypothetical protein [uncultured bacterium]AQS31126.1 hypothetical protein [uncultured bacterium]OGB73702.1 MAG: hypothetical protein A3K51_02605 [candidate division Kazan bacterium RIFCSPLOWO2_01_FULL_45_19]OGB77947.1 MAG: hypothetical protein A3K24_02605 [candidate division Kazan bacterium RIFCSPHIGHO2_01_FULL_44_14]